MDNPVVGFKDIDPWGDKAYVVKTSSQPISIGPWHERFEHKISLTAMVMMIHLSIVCGTWIGQSLLARDQSLVVNLVAESMSLEAGREENYGCAVDEPAVALMYSIIAMVVVLSEATPLALA